MLTRSTVDTRCIYNALRRVDLSTAKMVLNMLKVGNPTLRELKLTNFFFRAQDFPLNTIYSKITFILSNTK